MPEVATHNPEETTALGRSWGQSAEPGLVVGMTGKLGAGKTQIVKGMAQGLGIKDRVLSPTFSLVHQYTSGRIPLVHIDLYRLDTPSQVIGAGLEQFIYDPTTVVVIEWVERWFGNEPPALVPPGVYRAVRIETLGETSRRITYDDTRA
ncbi:MAG: tRNA (adenosine(37)-N6)-threonylcarbamoyltransferase complex ATPase subunit type 1 TsaE [Verrucomicrobia subdivision 3 bacterium]|nr:tRNA (adenosine(37)-N6)-threonylcarbamoyltransferase complex ATPase subunit type 1 TsaE [Limisphaerales bacterium]